MTAYLRRPVRAHLSSEIWLRTSAPGRLHFRRLATRSSFMSPILMTVRQCHQMRRFRNQMPNEFLVNIDRSAAISISGTWGIEMRRRITATAAACLMAALCTMVAAAPAQAVNWWAGTSSSGSHWATASGYIAANEISMPVYGSWVVGAKYCASGTFTSNSSTSTNYLGIGLNYNNQSNPWFINNNGTSTVTAYTPTSLGRPACGP